ncbi:hypothetical protein HYV50_00285 [Candidatus Pacearchaeota archaeon]|nr:hypothetical protein [Candidatus Pacearchaeota archaeon]
MVKVLDKFWETSPQRVSRLAEIANEQLGGSLRISVSKHQLIIGFYLLEEKIKVVFYIIPEGNVVDVFRSDYLETAIKLAEKYESLGEPEFIVRKRYS